VVAVGLLELSSHPDLLAGWRDALTSRPGGLAELFRTAVLAFPLLVLGLSGFETGVSMMPLVRAEGASPQEHLAARIRNTRRLLTVAAAIMSLYLLATTFVTTVLIPAAEFEEGGQANGRALAYLAHRYLGNGFGTVYDVSSILILWFAGASAMAGLINIVPAVPARIRDGARVGPGGATGGTGLHRGGGPDHGHIRRGRERAGWRLCHRHSRHDGLGGLCGDHESTP